MSYESVDALQNTLTREVFHYAKDGKKAAGRALGRLIEIVAFYLLRSWDFRDSIAIERRLAEYANPDITHNNELGPHIAHLEDLDALDCCVHVNHLHRQPYAVFECKRVGVEEGMKKGPQTIEKAKQGAYMASVSYRRGLK